MLNSAAVFLVALISTANAENPCFTKSSVSFGGSLDTQTALIKTDNYD